MENNYFEIVKYKKRNKFEYEVVPSSWVVGTKVYFPKNNINAMIKDAKTKPDVDNWLSYQMARIKRTGYEDYNEAVIRLDKMLDEFTTDTEGQDINEHQLKTRSKKHSVSHASNRMVQLQLPPVFQKVKSKMPLKNPPEMEPEPKSPEMTTMSEYLEDYEEAAGANSYQYQEGNQGLHYVVLQDAHTPAKIPATPVSITNNVETSLSVQPNFTAGENFIIGQLKHLSAKLIDLTNAVNIIMSSMEASTSKNEFGGGGGFQILTEEKLIQDEESLKQFEEQSDEREKQLRLELLVRIGKRQPAEVRSCCLELCDLLISHEFWQYTSWAGGTKDEGKPKFALQEHHTFLNFFKGIVREATNASYSDKDFAAFFQSKMKNRNQLPTKLKRAASRHRDPKKKRIEMSNDVEEYKYREYLEDE